MLWGGGGGLWAAGWCWGQGHRVQAGCRQVQAGCRLGAGWVQAGRLRGAGPPTPALQEACLDLLVAEHVEEPQLARLLVELAEAALGLAPQDGLPEKGLEVLVVRTPQRRVHGLRDGQPAGGGVELGGEVVGDGGAHVVGHDARARVAAPAVDAAAARVDEEQVLEAEVAHEDLVEHTRREGHDRPTPVARLDLPDVAVEELVVGQVNVDQELALHRLEELELLVVARVRREHGADVDLVGQLLQQVLRKRTHRGARGAAR